MNATPETIYLKMAKARLSSRRELGRFKRNSAKSVYEAYSITKIIYLLVFKVVTNFIIF